MNWYKTFKYAYSNGMSLFCEMHGYDLEDLYWMGSGDNGDAYQTSDEKIIKETRSQSEVNYARILKGKSGRFPKIYDVQSIGNTGYILQELVDVGGSHIEDMFYKTSEIIEQQGLDINHLNYIDEDETHIEQDVLSFINELSEIVNMYNTLGIFTPDIQPDNLGYNKNGNLVAIDIDARG